VTLWRNAGPTGEGFDTYRAAFWQAAVMEVATGPQGSSPDSPWAVTRQFFAARAAGWERRFPDDGPAFGAAVLALQPLHGGTVLDAGCGTGRALPFLRHAVGPGGRVVGLDLTPEMLAEAVARRGAEADLVQGDVNCLPLPTGSVDAVFGAGLLPHLRDPARGLAELARVTRPAGRLALFHPIGRVALAARHGRVPAADDIRADPAIRVLLRRAGWRVDLVDDGADRYLVVASRDAV
jgi:SAM-dependent methyltransferase